MAASRLPGSIWPVPARLSAVPWSTEVRTIGRPRVTLIPWPKLAYFSTGKPWSWYMASTASASARVAGLNSVSAGKGPLRRRPSARRASSAGMITSSSSRPRWPPSPACGFSPATRICGWAMPNLSRRSAWTMRNTSSSKAGVRLGATCASGRWVVASATRMPPPVSIITTRGVWVRSARYSVCPENATPASLITPLCTGAVTMAANCPARQPSIAASSVLST